MLVSRSIQVAAFRWPHTPTRKETREATRRARESGVADELDEDEVSSHKKHSGKGGKKHTSQSYKSYKQALAEWEDYTYEDYLEEMADIQSSDDDDTM